MLLVNKNDSKLIDVFHLILKNNLRKFLIVVGDNLVLLLRRMII